ncbi:MAG: S41 family peptidase [Defluviitaleaceae bacterium]|nr:S41 family peptidase [Defluviitaleaceae bacterium]
MGNKKSFVIGLATGMILLALLLVGYDMYDRHVNWDGAMRPNDKVNEIYQIVSRHSIIPVERADMIENMYRGLLAGVGDPYTQYLSLEALEAFYTRTRGEFVGIGVRVLMDPADNLLTLFRVFPDAPAAQAGLIEGDKILQVDGVDVAGFEQADIVALILGDAGTVVNIKIYRPDENRRFDVDITRARVIVPSVEYELIETENGRTGYIRIESFEQPTYSQFVAALTTLEALGMDSLIIDVRNNPGGLLGSVVNIANRLVPEGIIVYTQNVNEVQNVRRATADYLGLPLVMLVNGHSASASEVLGGAVQDTGVGSLVGEQTFGKGIVQHLYTLSDGTAIKLTVEKYFTPNGTSIHGIGLTPDFVVEMDSSLTRRIGDLPMEEDVQLQIALRMVQGK